MNWVGGSRNRLVMKNDAKRQKEFFERRKMQQRMKNMGVSFPASPPGTSSASMDLVTLFVVNQIAAKKVKKDPPKVAVLGSSKGGSRYKRNEPLVLPMSPCSPSKLNLVESKPQDSVQETRNNKQTVPHFFKYCQLSPVPESAFSDSSASDYLTPISDPFSLFPTSTASSSHVILHKHKNLAPSGVFPLQLNLQQCSQTQAKPRPNFSTQPWNTSSSEEAKETVIFQPFSQPRCMMDSIPWSSGSDPPLFQMETPIADRVLFGGSERDQLEDKEPMFDFTLNQPECELRSEDDIFRGFSSGNCEEEVSHCGGGQRIFLKDKTPVTSSAPQTVPESQCMGAELSNCNDMSFSCLECNSASKNSCDCLSSYSYRRDYCCSDSNDEEECSQVSCQCHAGVMPNNRAASSFIEQICSAENLNQKVDSQGSPKQGPTQPRLHVTPLPKPKTYVRDDSQVMENVTSENEEHQCYSKHIEIHRAEFDFCQAVVQTQNSEMWKCRKTTTETQDVGTQTPIIPMVVMHNASTQCSFVVDRVIKLCQSSVDVSVQHPAIGRQCDTTADTNIHTPSPGEPRIGDGHVPGSKEKSRATSLPGSNILNAFPCNKSDYSVFLQKPLNPLDDSRESNEAKKEI